MLGLSGLISKDLKLITRRRTLFIILLMVGFLLGMLSGSDFTVCYFSMFSALFVLSTIASDKKDNGLDFLFTLPIDVKTYVVSKYFLGFFMGVVLWLLGVVFLVLGVIYNTRTLNDMSFYLIFIFITMLMLAIGIPLELALKEKNNKPVLISTIVAGAIVFALAEGFANAAEEEEVANPAHLLTGIIVTIVITVISMIISSLILHKKGLE